ncbi:BON domain-containing protein [Pseudoxanthomonas dokdonensis]|uniref:BON domain-containing protein n=1 Tax=Pseudoxanthomonas dokdonensis TaxID=344882 RepID=UPI0007109423|nr:BON domain-containing protein [Pseudoxanthomonas dokdonensis]
MTDKHVGTELKAAFSELQALATRLASSSREWLNNRSEDMNQYRGDQADRDGRYEGGYGQRHGGSAPRAPANEEGRYPQDRDVDSRAAVRQTSGDHGDEDIRRGPWQTETWQDADSAHRAGREASGLRGSRSGLYGPQPGREHAHGDEFDTDRQYAGADSRPGSPFAEDNIRGGRSYSGRSGYGDQAGMGRSGRGSAYYSGRSGYRDDENELRGFNPGGSGQGWQQAGRQGRGGFDQPLRRDNYDHGFRGDEGDSRPRGYGYGRDGQSDDQHHRDGQYGYGRDGQPGYGGVDETRAWQAQGDYGHHRGRGPKGYKRSDERISEDLNEKLTEDPLLDASEITVSVKEGVATLQGSVENRWMKHRAEDVADSCSGVKDVRNEIRISARQGQTTTSASAPSDTAAATTADASAARQQKSSTSATGTTSGNASSGNH